MGSLGFLSLWNDVCLLSSSKSPEVTQDTGRTWKSVLWIDDLLQNPHGSVPKVHLAKLRRQRRACQRLQKAVGVWSELAPLRKTKRANTKVLLEKGVTQIYFRYKPLIWMERIADARTLWNVAKVIKLMSQYWGISSKGRKCRYAGFTETGGACGNLLRSPSSTSTPNRGANTQQAFVSLLWLCWNHRDLLVISQLACIILLLLNFFTFLWNLSRLLYRQIHELFVHFLKAYSVFLCSSCVL